MVRPTAKEKRKPETDEERRQRKKEEARARREIATKETLAKSRQECEQNPFVCIVRDQKQDDRLDNSAGESSSQQNAPWPSRFRGAKTSFSPLDVQLPSKPAPQNRQPWRKVRAVSTSSESFGVATSPPELPTPPERQRRAFKPESTTRTLKETNSDAADVGDTVYVIGSPSTGRRGRQRHRSTTPEEEFEVERTRESSIPDIAGLSLHEEYGSTTEDPFPNDISDAASGSRYAPSQDSEQDEVVNDTSLDLGEVVDDTYLSLNEESPPRTPANGSVGSAREGLAAEPGESFLSLQSSPGVDGEDSAFLRWASYATASSASQTLNSGAKPVLDRFIQAIHNRESRDGPTFLATQAKVYDKIFREVFGLQCDCKFC